MTFPGAGDAGGAPPYGRDFDDVDRWLLRPQIIPANVAMAADGMYAAPSCDTMLPA